MTNVRDSIVVMTRPWNETLTIFSFVEIDHRIIHGAQIIMVTEHMTERLTSLHSNVRSTNTTRRRHTVTAFALTHVSC